MNATFDLFFWMITAIIFGVCSIVALLSESIEPSFTFPMLLGIMGVLSFIAGKTNDISYELKKRKR